MADDGNSEVIEIDIAEWKKMKVVELRKKIGELGLDNKGNKSELISRLEKYLNEQEADLLDEEGEEEEEEGKVLDEVAEEDENEDSTNQKEPEVTIEEDKQKSDVTKINPPSGATIPVVGVASTESATEKLKSRQDRFGPSDSNAVKKQARAARFGLAVSDYQGLGKRPGVAPTTEEVEKLKKRAGRFGTTTGSTVLNKIADGEKKSKRLDRFGLPAADVQIKSRKERFGSS